MPQGLLDAFFVLLCPVDSQQSVGSPGRNPHDHHTALRVRKRNQRLLKLRRLWYALLELDEIGLLTTDEQPEVRYIKVRRNLYKLSFARHSAAL